MTGRTWRGGGVFGAALRLDLAGRLLAAVAGWGALALFTGNCGYRVAGKADLLPRDIRTIAIPAFGNVTTRPTLSQTLPGALTREFLRRTRYRVIDEPNEADAILFGTVVNYYSYPTIFDSGTGRAAGMQIMVVLDLRLVRKGSGEVLYQNSSLTIQDRYEISADQEAYFEESDTALRRLSNEVARIVVSTILENF